MFDKVSTNPNLIAGEHEVLRFWGEIRAFEKLRAKNRGGRRYRFLDGPITANNPMGVHHAWGRTYKDCYQRYFAMLGCEQRWQNGFDCQGLWVEVEVERELGFRSKRDIEEYGIARFVEKCKERVDRFARIQTEQSIRLGYWMDWDRDEDWRKPPDERRSYFTMSDENNYTIWAFLQKCHERGLIYKGFDAMPWCPRCGVGISQMEMHEGYERVAHRAVFVRLGVRGRWSGVRGQRSAVSGQPSGGGREYLLVWTTTPWTLTANVAAAVHPGLTYVKVRHRDETYYLAEEALTYPRLEEEFKRKEWIEGVPKLKTVAQILKERGGFEIEGELRGSELVGWEYEGPFDELPAQQHASGFPQQLAEVVRKQKWAPEVSAAAAHRVIPWDAVGATEGTGIVHIAPGCGREDFELGKQHGLPPIAPLDESGVFLAGFGNLEGRAASDEATTELILEHLRDSGRLVAVEQYPHAYPHCWRCKTELLFRLVDEWYLSMSWRDEIKRICHDIRWIPSFGLERELDWLTNMGDWMISKKRYWGLALPIWECTACGSFEVIGGEGELKERAVAGWQEFADRSPHRPWVDRVEIACAKCGGRARRIPDVGNPWLDAGIVPFSTLKYRTDRAYWEQWFPADFVTECFPGQFRNWFYALLAMSAMMEGRAPFKTLLGHALVRDERGEEMHKSKGNAIPFDEAAEKAGSDVMRWLFCRHNPVNNLNFGYTPLQQVERQVFGTLWNTYAFFVNYARADEFDPARPQVPVGERPEIDRWVLSELHRLVRSANERMPEYDVAAVVRAAEAFIEQLSNWYVRRNRRRFWRAKDASDRDKLAAYQTLYEVLLTLVKLLAPVTPFVTERMYQNLVFGRGRVGQWAGETGSGVRGQRSGEEAKGEREDVSPHDAAHSPTRPLAGSPPESVHLCGYPQADESLIDEALSFRMGVAQQIVKIGHSLREKARIKTRQPLSELRVAAAGEATREAAQSLAEVIRDELNVKQLAVSSDLSELISLKVKPNFAVLGPKYGKALGALGKALAALPREQAQQLAAGGTITVEAEDQKPGISEKPRSSESYTLGPNDVQIETVQPEGWVAASERELQVALNTAISPDLAREGTARDVVRHIQEMRKEADLEITDRIGVRYQTAEAPIREAIAAWSDYICAETLAHCIADDLPAAEGKPVKLPAGTLRLDIRKA